MRLFQYLDNPKNLTIFTWFITALFAAWLLCMVVLPLIIQQDIWDWCTAYFNWWKYVDSVWDKWQTINAGIFAIIASWIGLNISKAREDRQRIRDFVASKAFLPEACSELTAYFRECAKSLNDMWNIKMSKNNDGYTNQDVLTNKIKELNIPDLPEKYKNIFAECIKKSEPKIGNYLANILLFLQIHDARLRSSVDKSKDIPLTHSNIVTYIFELGKLQVLIDHIFYYVRDPSKEIILDPKQIEWKDFNQAYFNLAIEPEDITLNQREIDLKKYTEDSIQKGIKLFIDLNEKS